jgi:predicted pyridoxine 5'-phosphate oxidase superfamily flavin-nucleotide-binding protein
MLTPDVMKYMDSSVLCLVATVDLNGASNVSPKEIFVSHGTESVLISNIASPTTIGNIQVSPKVCLSFVDVFIQKGYKLLGNARVVAPQDSEFAGFIGPLEKLTKVHFQIHSAICIRVKKVELIVSPSYRFESGTTESSQVQSALKTYGVTRNETIASGLTCAPPRRPTSPTSAKPR